MKKLINIILTLAFCLTLAGMTQAQMKNLITAGSVGDLRIGMTVAEARKILKEYKLERTSDGEGIALIGVTKKGDYSMLLYAGEEDAEAKIDEQAKIQQIEILDKSYKTAEGVHPGLSIAEAEKKYGKLKEIWLTEIESREYATFSNHPKGIEFKVYGNENTAGIYTEGEMRSAKYTPKAYISTIIINNLEDSKKSEEDFKTLDISGFNKKIEKAAASNESWVKIPMFVIAQILEPFSEMKSRNIEIVSPFADVTESLTVIVIDDGYADDSVRGEKFKFELKVNEQGVWQVVSAQKAQHCQEGRGHQNYSTQPCL